MGMKPSCFSCILDRLSTNSFIVNDLLTDWTRKHTGGLDASLAMNGLEAKASHRGHHNSYSRKSLRSMSFLKRKRVELFFKIDCRSIGMGGIIWLANDVHRHIMS